ncbi:unnamed protein product, partial [Staurois parvus]
MYVHFVCMYVVCMPVLFHSRIQPHRFQLCSFVCYLMEHKDYWHLFYSFL